MRLILLLCVIVAAALATYALVDLTWLSGLAIEAQRGFQNQMAGAVRGLKAGDPGAYLALLTATGAYGFVHALGPGHGKYLVGGVGLASGISSARLVGLAVASSLAQSLWAILLVYGGFFLLAASAAQLTDLAENILAPASYLAITLVGAYLMLRGVQALRRASEPAQSHRHNGCCGHAHGPTPDQAAGVTSLREAAALIFSIAIRPCTGAIFLLVIAWQMDIRLAGALAVMVMGLGTAGLTSLVAVSSVAARRITIGFSTASRTLHLTVPILEVFAGALVVAVSLSLLGRVL